MDTVLITVPQMWGSTKRDQRVEGMPIDDFAYNQKQKLDTLLHKEGYRVKCMSSYVYEGVVMMHYALEREDQVTVQGDWHVRSEEPL